MIRVLLADDQALVRGGFRLILDNADDIEVVAEAADGAEAIRLCQEHVPDVALLDVRMPGTDGLRAAQEILRGASTTKVVMLTTFGLDEYVYEALRAGASGYLLKDVDPPDLVHAVRSAHRGDLALSPSVARLLAQEYVGSRPAAPQPDPRIDALTAREREVLAALATGATNAEIADQLVVSLSTVKTHVASILTKLGLRDRVQAVIAAYESGLAPSP